jgi:hypothetical protein
MSISVCVSARKRIALEERRLCEAYNTLVHNRIDVPFEMQEKLTSILGREPEYGWDEPLDLDYDEYLELRVSGKGDVMYYDGMVLKLEDLPPGTVELRIYVLS